MKNLKIGRFPQLKSEIRKLKLDGPICGLRFQDLSCGNRRIFRFLPVLILYLVGISFAQEQRTTWDGVYTSDQSKRGQAVFLDACANCHGRNLEGADMTPPLTGGAFTANWDGLTLGDLADRIRISMPLNAPGSVSRQDTADVVAYILQFNQFPAGQQELPREVAAMKQILFKARQ